MKNVALKLQSVWNYSMFYQIFLSSQVRWRAIITYKQGIHELPHELLND